MPETITCHVCGEVNPADQEFCQSCQSRLQPLTGPLKGADAPIKPGQMPTRKNTAELEPILPQWLREARDKARKSAEEQATNTSKESQPEPNAAPPDFLAGLQSQTGEEEEDIPDWLAGITGAKPKAKKSEAESTEVRWVELGKPDEFAPEATQEPAQKPAENELPSWLAGAESTEQSGADEVSAWIRESRLEPEADEPTFFTEAEPGSAQEAPRSDEDLPDWLKSLQAEQAAEAESSQAEPPQAGIESDADWLKTLQESAEQGAPPPISPEVPAWLKEETGPSQSAAEDIPSWLRSSEESTAEEAMQGHIPDWLKSAAPQSSVFEEGPAAPLETPDWLAAMQKGTAASAFKPETPEVQSPPAFTENSLIGENADALFTEMPDWLSSVEQEQAETSSATSTPSTASEAEALVPGELPSWVQAMRPVESSITQPPGEGVDDQALETRGALAGLQGVLPAMAGVGPSSKPKAYSITLNASEEQLAHVTLLDQILAAETAPEPIASYSPLAAQRGLRWFLAILLLVVVSSVLFLRTQIFAVPAGETNEIQDARLVTEALPQGAPMLVVIDYEPAFAGEMEAIAAPLLEHAIILKQPVLTFISTSPTGGALAEHLMSAPLRARGYQRGTQYLNLGYLPGGLSGVRAFAQNPRAAAPFLTELTFLNPSPAWQDTPLQSVTSLSQFAAMIVITDNAEVARTWIEQTEAMRGTSPLVVVSSAQAAPMIEPYYESRQVNGLVSGLYGGTIIEQSNGDLPNLAQNYWDASSIGLLLAALVIVIGALWNLGLSFRDRTAAEGK